MKSILTNHYFLFYVPIALAFLLPRIPKFGNIFKVFNTMIHEDGHAFMALITNGSIYKIKLNFNTSGEATTASKYWISTLLVSLAGYACPPLAAYGIFYLVAHGKLILIFWILGIMACLNLIFWVRNKFGIIWLVCFLLICVAIIYWGSGYPTLVRCFAFFLCGILLFENLFSTLVLLKLASTEPKKSGDAANLTKYTYIPAIVWSLVFLLFAVYMGYLTVIKFFPL